MMFTSPLSTRYAHRLSLNGQQHTTDTQTETQRQTHNTPATTSTDHSQARHTERRTSGSSAHIHTHTVYRDRVVAQDYHEEMLRLQVDSPSQQHSHSHSYQQILRSQILGSNLSAAVCVSPSPCCSSVSKTLRLSSHSASLTRPFSASRVAAFNQQQQENRHPNTQEQQQTHVLTQQMQQMKLQHSSTDKDSSRVLLTPELSTVFHQQHLRPRESVDSSPSTANNTAAAAAAAARRLEFLPMSRRSSVGSVMSESDLLSTPPTSGRSSVSSVRTPASRPSALSRMR